MSPMIVPAEGDVMTLYKGRTFIPTWTLYDTYVAEDDPGNVPTNFDDWEGFYTITGKDGAIVVQLTTDTGVLPTTNAQGISGVVLDAYTAGGIAVVFTDEDASALLETQFEEATNEEGQTIWVGRYDLTLQDAAGERFPFETGDILFVPLPLIAA